MFDITEEELKFREQADRSLAHVLGAKDEQVRFLPDLSKSDSMSKEARRKFTEREKQALIEEHGEAMNAHKVDVKGTHYETQSASEIAMSILPLMGL